MFGAIFPVNFIDRIYNGNNMLHRYGLIGSEHNGSFRLIIKFFRNAVLKDVFSHWRLFNKEMLRFIDVNRDALLRHGFAAAAGQKQFDGIRGNQCRSYHKKDKQQKYQVRHGGHAEGRADFITGLDWHNVVFKKRVREEGP